MDTFTTNRVDFTPKSKRIVGSSWTQEKQKEYQRLYRKKKRTEHNVFQINPTPLLVKFE